GHGPSSGLGVAGQSTRGSECRRGWEVLGIDLNRSEPSRSSEQSWPCGKAVSLWLKVGSLEELGAAVEIACDKSRERLRGLRHRFNAERRQAPLGGQIFHRVIDPAVDGLDEISRHTWRSPQA